MYSCSPVSWIDREDLQYLRNSAYISSVQFVAETKWIHFYCCKNQFTGTDVQNGKTSHLRFWAVKGKLNMTLQWDLPFLQSWLSVLEWCLGSTSFAVLVLNWSLSWIKFWSITGLLGIQDLSKPDYGDSVQLHSGDIPMFWACGVTGIEAIINCSMYYVWRLFSLSFFKCDWISWLISRLDFRVS